MENNVNNVKVEYGCIIDALKTIRVYNLPVYSLLIFFKEKSHPKNWNLPGIFKPFSYLGEKNSFFTIHTEDGNLKACNILRRGSKKFWFSSGPKFFKEFQSILEVPFEEEFNLCSEYIRHKECFINPSAFKTIPIYTTVTTFV